jgi:hypothetical protein
MDAEIDDVGGVPSLNVDDKPAHSLLMFAALTMGHHRSISAFSKAASPFGDC